MLRYADKSDRWRFSLVAAELFVLLAITISIAVWMWQDMSRSGGLGADERLKEHGRPITKAQRGVRGHIDYALAKGGPALLGRCHLLI